MEGGCLDCLTTQHLVGIAHINISSLALDEIEEKSRQEDPNIVQHLVNVFDSNSCDPNEPRNHISADVTSVDLESILQRSSVTISDLQISIVSGDYPTLHIVHEKIHCQHGRHRLKAALNRPDPTEWWTIKLYVLEDCKTPPPINAH